MHAKESEEDPELPWKVYRSYGRPELEEAKKWLDSFLHLSLKSAESPLRAHPDIVQELVGVLFEESKNFLRSSESKTMPSRIWRILRFLEELWEGDFVINNGRGFVESLIDLLDDFLEVIKYQSNFERGENEEESTVSFNDVLSLWKEVDSKYAMTSFKNDKGKKKKLLLKNSKKTLRTRHRQRSRHKSKTFKENVKNTVSYIEKNVDMDSDSTPPEGTTIFSFSSSRFRHYPRNPLDFEYFETAMRSEDESLKADEWRRSIRSGYGGTHLIIPQVPEDKPKSDMECIIVLLNLLKKLLDREVRLRNIKTSYVISLVISTFANQKLSDSLCALENKSENLKLHILKILLTSLAELAFNAKENSQIIISSLNFGSQLFHRNKLQSPTTAVQIQSCLLRIVSSIRKTLSLTKKTPANEEEEKKENNFLGSLIQNDDVHQTLKFISMNVKSIPSIDVAEYFSELKEILISFEGSCCFPENANLHSSYRSLIVYSPSLLTTYGAEFILPILNVESDSTLCAHPNTVWDYLLLRSLNPPSLEVYNVVERILVHYSYKHVDEQTPIKPFSEPTTSSSLNNKHSDSDSAFCTSENSLDLKDPSSDEEISCPSGYLVLLNKFLPDYEALMDLTDHIMRLMNKVSSPMKKKIFVDVILPTLRLAKTHQSLSSFCLSVIGSCVNYETSYVEENSLKSVEFYCLSASYDVLSQISEIIETQNNGKAYFAYAAFVSRELFQSLQHLVTDFFHEDFSEESVTAHPDFYLAVKSVSENPIVKNFYEFIALSLTKSGDFRLLWAETLNLIVTYPHFKSFCKGKGLSKIARESLKPNFQNVDLIAIILKVLIQLDSVKKVLPYEDLPQENNCSPGDYLENVVEYYVDHAPSAISLRPIVKEIFSVNFLPKTRCQSSSISPIFDKKDFFNSELSNRTTSLSYKYEASDEESFDEGITRIPPFTQMNPFFLQDKSFNENEVVVLTSFHFITAIGQQFPSVAQFGICLWIRACKAYYEVREFLYGLKVGTLLLCEFKTTIATGKKKYRDLIDSIVFFIRISTIDFQLDRKDFLHIIDIFKGDSASSTFRLLELFKTLSLRDLNPISPKYSVSMTSPKPFKFQWTNFPAEFSFAFWLKSSQENGTVITFCNEKGFFIEISLISEGRNIVLRLSSEVEENLTVCFYSKGLLHSNWNHIVISIDTTGSNKPHVFVNGTKSFANKSVKYPIYMIKDPDLTLTLNCTIFEMSDVRICKGFFKEEDSLLSLMRGYQFRELNAEFVLKRFPGLVKKYVSFKEEFPLITFDARNPDRLFLYDGQDEAIPSSLLPPNVVFNHLVSQKITNNHSSRLWNVVDECGGSGTLLLLLARLTELELTDEHFSIGLEIIFNVTFGSYEAKEDFDLLEGFLLLSSILGHGEYGVFTLSVIINKSLNEDILVYDAHSRSVRWRDPDRGPLLLYPHLLESLLFIPNLLSDSFTSPYNNSTVQNLTGANSLFEIFLKALNRLIDFSNEFHTSNQRRLAEINFDSRIVYYLKESSAESSEFVLTKCVVEEIGDMFGTLIGSPPDDSVVEKVVKHAILLHDPCYTFVSHGQSSFYYCSKVPIESAFDEENEKLESSDLENPLPWGGVGEEESNGEEEDALTVSHSMEDKLTDLLRRLLDVLGNSLINTPDCSRQRLTKIFKPEYLLTWANHPHQGVRVASIRLTNVWLQRSFGRFRIFQDQYENRTKEINFLLANQISLYPVTEDIVEECLCIAHGVVGIHFLQLQEHSFKELGIRHKPVDFFIPVLSLLPGCVYDIPLAHNLITHLHKELAADNKMLDSLINEYELLRVLCKTLSAISKTRPARSDLCGQDSREILVFDLYNIFRLIVFYHVTEAKTESYEIVEKLVYILQNELISNNSHPFIYNGVCVVFEEALTNLQASVCAFFNSSTYNARQKTINSAPPIFQSTENLDSPFKNEETAPVVISSANCSRLTNRFSKLIKLACEFVYCRTPHESKRLTELEKSFIISLVVFLLNELSQISERPKIRSIIPKEELKCNISRLVTFCLSPLPDLELRIRTLQCLSVPKAFNSVFKLSQGIVYLIKDLVQNYSQLMKEEDRELCFNFVCERNEDVFSKFSYSEDSVENVVQFLSENRNFHLSLISEKIQSFASSFESYLKTLTNTAVQYTQSVMKFQDTERKAYIDFIRENLTDKVKAQRGWKVILDQLTHEMGPWVVESFRPKSWYLGEVEGAQRMRIRLERNHSDISERHYILSHRYKAVRPSNPPFEFLLKGPIGMSEIIIDKLNTDDRISRMEQCMLVLPDDEFHGEILLSSKAIYYVHEKFSMTWYLSELKEIYFRRYQLKELAVELFLSNGMTRLLVFGSKETRNSFADDITEKVPGLQEQSDPESIMKMWVEGAMTNFDYLMELNKLAGRTFNDLMQYPIYPFILSDYSSKMLDLKSAESYRILRKPVSVQKVDKEKHYIDNYTALAAEYARKSDFAGVGLGPYHYGSHYSNSGIVLYFLLRLPPFTSMFLKYQDGNFDLPDRTFHSMADTWRLASLDSSTDVKELIPDLFCLPELLINGEGLFFGVRQNGDVVNDVRLPPWSNDDPRLFIKIHRQALESRFVRENLNHWIDLVFGYKQSGQPSIDAINVFHPATYYGFDVDSIEDPVQRSARSTMIQTYGQTPKQLFTKPHPMMKLNLTDEVCKNKRIDCPIDTIIGLRWGNYIGSPDEKEPVIVWKSCLRKLTRSLIATSDNVVYGLPSHVDLAFLRSNNHAIISWRHPEEQPYLRLRLGEYVQKYTINDGEITSAFVCSQESKIWIGTHSGKISVLMYDENLCIQPEKTVKLYAHSFPIRDIQICREFWIVSSVSSDGTVVFWDLRSPHYIRSFSIGEGMVEITRISETCGDFAVSARIDKSSSKLSIFTINGNLIQTRTVEPPIVSLAFSSSPEGVSVNAIATGHSSGIIRLWSSWDLTPIRDIPTFQYFPVVALVFSKDNEHLYASTLNKEIIVFEKAEFKGFSQSPTYLYCDDNGDSFLLQC